MQRFRPSESTPTSDLKRIKCALSQMTGHIDKLMFSFAWIVLASVSGFAGELFEDFETDQLDQSIWWAKTTGEGAATIENGFLTLSTVKTEDSIFLFYRDPIPPGVPITVELRINFNQTEEDGWFGFLRDVPGDSHHNGIINELKDDATMFFIYNLNAGFGSAQSPVGEDVYLPAVQDRGIPFAADEFHTFKIEVTEDAYRMSIDGQELRTGVRNDSRYTNRMFYITPDGFDNFYGPAKYTIDWIRLSGPTVTQPPTAIGPSTWGEVKAR